MNKAKQIISWILTGLIAFVLVAGGVSKIAGTEPEQVMAFLTKMGYAPYLSILGAAELLIAALYLYPKTSKIGFLLVNCYFGGALSLEFSGGQPPFSVVFIALAWIAMFLSHQEMFFRNETASL